MVVTRSITGRLCEECFKFGVQEVPHTRKTTNRGTTAKFKCYYCENKTRQKV